VVEGSTHSPGPLKEYASLLLTAAGYLCLAWMMLGQQLLAPLGLVEPPWLAEQREARWPPMVAFFLLNQLGGSLKSTGAFEVTLNGQLIHSKLASAAVPSTAALARRISEITGLAPDAGVMAQVGLQL
jgi:selT/selW/selH-like putative selenoprotein